MSWQAEIDALRRRQALVRQMGGEAKLTRHAAQGKLNVRQRVTALLDEGSFREIGSISGRAAYDAEGELQSLIPANLVMGRGRIAGRAAVVSGDDFTVRGGANDAAIGEKMVNAEMLAADWRMPIVRLVDGTGGGGSVRTIEQVGHTLLPGYEASLWHFMQRNLETVPVVGLALGSTAGLGAARVAHSHYSLIVRETAQMFVAGPPVVARVGPQLAKNELGGSAIHTRNGAIDDEVASEEEAFAYTRRFLSYLPSSVYTLPARVPNDDPPSRQEDWLIGAIPRDRRKVYKIRPLVEALFDRHSVFEIGRQWGRPVMTALARLDGWPVAVLASDPYFYAGAWTADACRKILRMVDLAENFHLPLVHLVDIPGFFIGVKAEQEATIRYGAQAMSAILQGRTPWATVILRKVFGVAGSAHQNAARYCLRVAWPSGDWGSLPVEGGIEAAYRAELEASADPEKHLAAIGERLERLRSPFRSAERFMPEEIIDPRETRPLLCEFANLAAPLREPGPYRHGLRP